MAFGSGGRLSLRNLAQRDANDSFRRSLNDERAAEAGVASRAATDQQAQSLAVQRQHERLLAAQRRQERGRGPSSRDRFLQSMLDSINQANTANAARRDEILGGMNALRDRTLGGLATLGEAEAGSINRSFSQQQSVAGQSAVSRGITASTVAGSQARSIDNDRIQQLSHLKERLARERIQADTSLSNNIFSFQERINETGPSNGQLFALLGQLGQQQ